MVTVLVVDDEQPIRSMLREVLEWEGYAVYEAEHGGPALEQLRASAVPLLVVLGLMMPVVDGLGVLRAVAADPMLAARHRFIMLTGNTYSASTGPVAELRQQLGVPLLPKPCTADQLLNAVAEVAASMP